MPTFIEVNNQTKVDFVQQMKIKNTERKTQSAVDNSKHGSIKIQGMKPGTSL